MEKICDKKCLNCKYADCVCEDYADMTDIDTADEIVLNFIIWQRNLYELSEKGIERRKRYEQTDKAKDRRKKYEQTSKAKKRHKRYYEKKYMPEKKRKRLEYLREYSRQRYLKQKESKGVTTNG